MAGEVRIILQRWFIAHPSAIGETYVAHQRTALRFSMILLLAAFACFVHALIPGIFQHSASRRIAQLNAEMKRRAAPETVAPSGLKNAA